MTRIVEMRVHMDCLGCKNKIEKALKQLNGVDDVDIDMYMQKVTVTGWAEQKKVLKKVRKTGRKAELWPFPYNSQYHDYAQSYYKQSYSGAPSYYYSTPANYYPSSESTSTYNCRSKHGYNGHDHGYYQQPPSSASYSGPPSYYYSTPANYYPSSELTSTYNYRKHGYNGHDHGYYQQPPSSVIFDEQKSSMFSDDNATGCSIM